MEILYKVWGHKNDITTNLAKCNMNILENKRVS
jgi:hypothetical protein